MIKPIALDNSELVYSIIPGTLDAGSSSYCNYCQQAGPFTIGGNLYTVSQWTNVSGSIPVQVYKSTDLGVTWAVQDSAHGPDTFPSFSRMFACSILGAIVYVMYDSGSGNLKIRPFDTGTGLWGSDSAVLATGQVHTDTFGISAAASKINAVYQVQPSTSSMFAAQYDIGLDSWGSPTAIGTDIVNPLLVGTTIEDDGSLDVFYVTREAFGGSAISPNPVQQIIIAADGTIGAPGTLIADATQPGSAGFFFSYPSICPGVTHSGIEFFPFSYMIGGAAPPVPGSTVGQVALSDTTNDPLYTTGAYSYALFDTNTSKVYYLWFNRAQDGLGNDIRQLRWSSTTDGVTFTTPVTAWDQAVNPIPGLPSNLSTVNFSNLSAQILSNGDVGVTFNIDTNDGQFGRYFFSFPFNADELVASCNNPPPAQLGIDYLHTLGASGGSSPYTFAIIDGMLPKGLVLNSSTGIITGKAVSLHHTPTFTVRVTDNTAGTATAVCSIDVVGTVLEVAAGAYTACNPCATRNMGIMRGGAGLRGW